MKASSDPHQLTRDPETDSVDSGVCSVQSENRGSRDLVQCADIKGHTEKGVKLSESYLLKGRAVCGDFKEDEIQSGADNLLMQTEKYISPLGNEAFNEDHKNLNYMDSEKTNSKNIIYSASTDKFHTSDLSSNSTKQIHITTTDTCMKVLDKVQPGFGLCKTKGCEGAKMSLRGKGKDLFSDIFEEFSDKSCKGMNSDYDAGFKTFSSAGNNMATPKFAETEKQNPTLHNSKKGSLNGRCRKTGENTSHKVNNLFADIFEEYGRPENTNSEQIDVSGKFNGFKTAGGNELKSQFMDVHQNAVKDITVLNCKTDGDIGNGANSVMKRPSGKNLFSDIFEEFGCPSDTCTTGSGDNTTSFAGFKSAAGNELKMQYISVHTASKEAEKELDIKLGGEDMGSHRTCKTVTKPGNNKNLFSDIFDELGCLDSATDSKQGLSGFKSAAGSELKTEYISVHKNLNDTENLANGTSLNNMTKPKASTTLSTFKSNLFSDIFEELGSLDKGTVLNSGFTGFKSAAGNDLKPQSLNHSNSGRGTSLSLQAREKEFEAPKPNTQFRSVGKIMVNRKVEMKSASLAAKFSSVSSVPQGFRPFKPPKITKRKLEPEKTLSRESEKEQKFGDVSKEENKDVSVDVNVQNLENSPIDDMFTDEMEPSQKFSPQSGRPVKKAKLDVDNSGVQDGAVEQIPEGNVLTKDIVPSRVAEQIEKTSNVIMANVYLKTEQTSCVPCSDVSLANSEKPRTHSYDSDFGEEFCDIDELEMMEKCFNSEQQITDASSSKKESNEECWQKSEKSGCIDTNKEVKIPGRLTGHFDSVEGQVETQEDRTKNLEMNDKLGFGFTTASGRSVAVSNKSLQTARKILNDSKSDVVDNEHAVGACVTKSSDECGTPQERVEKSNETENVENTLLSCTEFAGENSVPAFTTASGKSVSVSRTSLDIARKMAEDVANIEDLCPNENSIVPVISASYSDKAERDDLNAGLMDSANAKLDTEFKNNNQNVNHVEASRDIVQRSPFQSASGKNIEVSEKSLNAVREKWSENAKDNMDCSKTALKEDWQFQSASGKSISGTESSLKTVRKNSDSDTGQKPVTELLENTYGRSADMSENFLMSVKKSVECGTIPQNSPFQSASGKSISVSESALKVARKTLSNEENPINTPFQSAAGKDVHVAESSLQAARKSLSTDEKCSPFQSASGKAVSVSESSLLAARKTLQTEEKVSFSPFQNASGEAINVSDSALQATRKTLQMEEKEPLSPFQSASGKTVGVSEKSLQAARKTLQMEEKESRSPFQSASGKTVGVSEKSLQAARKNLQMEEKESRSPFQSASGKTVGVSEKSLQAVRHAQDSENKSSNFPSFVKPDRLQGMKASPGPFLSTSAREINQPRTSPCQLSRQELLALDDFLVPDDFDDEMELPPTSPGEFMSYNLL